ncbi:MAG: iron export ABC transporter permease subunit FetB [Candidatus Paralactobacillus gallistercoris]|uniref:Iron export ABC transporter permease subunit FetB n=1 Tax=Candidatus Paralactobacillus gallistercoris TaxID=2838724 RepID=A0A948TID1_9LACO|nr:iron export ABC transporter permease subunit FetB [Candidatus Paralactobacillus gallistercoris]
MNLNVNNFSLCLAAILVVIAIMISSQQKLGLTKDIIISITRAIIQLVIVGYILLYVFKVNNLWLTLTLMLLIIFNASWNAIQRGKAGKHGVLYSFIAIFSSTTITITTLTLSGAIKFIPMQVVPISGMIASNVMVAISLCYRELNNAFKTHRQQILEKLALGATPAQAAKSIIHHTIKTGMVPTINSAKTVGLVSLPGMMTGLIFAGVNPLYAIKYQIMVTFMLMAATSIGAIIAVYLTYHNHFNKRMQLIEI